MGCKDGSIRSMLTYSLQEAIKIGKGIDPSFRPFIHEIVELIAAEGERCHVPIRRVRVHLFSSREVPNYQETVITFFSDAGEDRIIDFFPRLAEATGVWRRQQKGIAREGFAEQLAVDIMPLEFWDDVRP